jgi:hypothetical protein
MGKEVLSVLLVREENTIKGGGDDFKTKKVMKRTQILELLIETLLHKCNMLRIITRDDHVIDIEKKKDATTRGVDKKSRTVVTRLEASIDDNRGEILKPSPRSLLKTIKRTLQPTIDTKFWIDTRRP